MRYSRRRRFSTRRRPTRRRNRGSRRIMRGVSRNRYRRRLGFRA